MGGAGLQHREAVAAGEAVAGERITRPVQAIGADWQGWLSQGLGNFDLTVPVPSRLPVAYYADCLFRGLGMGITEPENLTPLGQRLFVAWVAELRDSDQLAVSVSEGALTVPLRESADWLTEHHGAWAQRVVTACVEELATYFDPAHGDRREAARARAADGRPSHHGPSGHDGIRRIQVRQEQSGAR